MVRENKEAREDSKMRGPLAYSYTKTGRGREFALEIYLYPRKTWIPKDLIWGQHYGTPA